MLTQCAWSHSYVNGDCYLFLWRRARVLLRGSGLCDVCIVLNRAAAPFTVSRYTAHVRMLGGLQLSTYSIAAGPFCQARWTLLICKPSDSLTAERIEDGSLLMDNPSCTSARHWGHTPMGRQSRGTSRASHRADIVSRRAVAICMEAAVNTVAVVTAVSITLVGRKDRTPSATRLSTTRYSAERAIPCHNLRFIHCVCFGIAAMAAVWNASIMSKEVREGMCQPRRLIIHMSPCHRHLLGAKRQGLMTS